MAMNFPCKYLFYTPQGSLTCRKSYDMGPTALLPLRRKSRYGFVSPLKIHRPRPGMNPRTLGTMASTINTRPPRATICALLLSVWSHFPPSGDPVVNKSALFTIVFKEKQLDRQLASEY
jgi:hypothetical protein